MKVNYNPATYDLCKSKIEIGSLLGGNFAVY